MLRKPTHRLLSLVTAITLALGLLVIGPRPALATPINVSTSGALYLAPWVAPGGYISAAEDHWSSPWPSSGGTMISQAHLKGYYSGSNVAYFYVWAWTGSSWVNAYSGGYGSGASWDYWIGLPANTTQIKTEYYIYPGYVYAGTYFDVPEVQMDLTPTTRTVNVTGASISNWTAYTTYQSTWTVAPAGTQLSQFYIQGSIVPGSGAYINYYYIYNGGWYYAGQFTGSYSQWLTVPSGYNGVTQVGYYYYTGSSPNGYAQSVTQAVVVGAPYLPLPPTLSSNTSLPRYQQTVSWSAPGNPSGTTYELWRKTFNSSGSVVKDEAIYGGSNTQFTTTDQQAGTYYTYRVRSVYQGVSSNFTSEVAYVTPPVPSVTAGPTSLAVSWPAVYPGVTYRILYTPQGGSQTLAGTTTGLSYSISGLSPATSYLASLQMNLPAGGTQWGSSFSSYVTPLAATPGAFTFSGQTQTGLTAAWGANGNAGATYDLWFRSSVPGGAVAANGSFDAIHRTHAGVATNTNNTITYLGGGWTAATDLNTATIGQATEGPNDFLRFTSDGSTRWTAAWTPWAVTANKWYRVTVSARTSSTTGVDVSGYALVTGGLGTGGTDPQLTWTGLKASDGWKTATVVFQATENATGSTFLYGNQGAAGTTVDFDNVVIEQCDARPANQPGTLTEAGVWGTSSTTAVISGLQPGTQYVFMVQAMNGNLVPSSGYSTGTSYTLTLKPSIPTVQGDGLTWSSTAGRDWAKVYWQPVAGATGYRVYIHDGNTFRAFDAGTPASLEALTDTSWTHGQLLAGIGALDSASQPTFSRSTAAYNLDGTQVGLNTPRYAPGKYGNGVLVEETAANLLTANQSDVETDLSGWGLNYGVGTITRDTTTAWHGAASVKWTTSDTSQWKGISTSSVPINVANGEWVVASAYVKGSGRAAVAVSQGPWLGNFTWTALSNSWQRVTATWQNTTGSTQTVWLEVGQYGDPGTMFWVDGAQVEKRSYQTSATTWTIGGTTRAAEFLSVPTDGVLSPSQGTVEWVMVPQETPQVWARIFDWGGGWTSPVTKDDLRVGWNTGQGANVVSVAFDQANAGEAQAAVTLPQNLQVGKPYYVAVRWQLPGWIKLTVYDYTNGLAYNSTTNTTLTPAFAGYSAAYLGGDAWGEIANTVVDDFRASSVARSDAEITVAYGSGQPLPADASTTYKAAFDGSLAVTQLATAASSWGQAADLGPVGTTVPWINAPSGIQDSSAHWLSLVPGGMVSPGHYYAYRPFTLQTGGSVTIYAAADDSAVVYVDGARVLTVTGPQIAASGIVTLSAGDHTIAIDVTNGGTGLNPSGFAVAAYDSAPSLLFDTVPDGSWRVYGQYAWDSRQAKVYPAESTLDAAADNSISTDVFNHSATGLDLRDTPSKLYRKTVGTTYDSTNAYHFAVSAYNASGDSGLTRAVSATLPVRTETTPPTGTILINNDQMVAGGPTVTLNLSATDPPAANYTSDTSDDASGVSTMRFSNDGSTWSAWVPYATLYSWKIDVSSFGKKTVYAQFQDAAGNVSSTVSDDVYYYLVDAQAPNVTLTINNGADVTSSPQVQLQIDAKDDLTPSTDLQMRFSTDFTIWTAWEGYTPYKTWTFPPGDGQKTLFVQVKDASANIGTAYSKINLVTTAGSVLQSSGVFWSDSGTGGTAYPSGQAAQARFITASQITLRLNAPGASQVQFGFDNVRWLPPEPAASEKVLSLPDWEGYKTVYAKLSTGTTYSVTFVLDRTAPIVDARWLGDATVTNAGTAVILLTATDNFTRQQDLQYSLDGGATWHSYTAQVTVTFSGTGYRTETIMIRDQAGNTAVRTIGIFN